MSSESISAAGIEAVRRACAELRESEGECGCTYSPHTLPPCRAAIARAEGRA